MTRDDFALMLPPTRIMCAEVSEHPDVAAVLGDLGSRDVDAILFSIDDVIRGRLPSSLPAVWPPSS